MPTTISVSLTNEEAENFKEFMRYRILFLTMVEAGAFATKNGQVILHFDSQGNMREIEKHIVVYKK